MRVLQKFLFRILFALFFKFYPVFLRFLYICLYIDFHLFWSFLRHTAIKIVFCLCIVMVYFNFLRLIRFPGFLGNSRPIYEVLLAVLNHINFCMIICFFLLKFCETTVFYAFFLYLPASIVRIKPSVSDNLRYVGLFLLISLLALRFIF